jgi:RHS repeat-associated protein
VHNTNWTTTSVDKHYTLPFGEQRGGVSAPGDHEFLGKVRDASIGLTLVGARWYDETVGRFLTVDPVMDLMDPQQWNAYSYANNNPTTWSDPTGLKPDGCENTCVYYGGEWGVGGGKSDPRPSGGTPPDGPDPEDVTNDKTIDWCKVLLICPGEEEPLDYPTWLDNYDAGADKAWLATIGGIEHFFDVYVACVFDLLGACDEYAEMLVTMPQNMVEGTVAGAQEIRGAFAAGDVAGGAGLASVGVVSVIGTKGTGRTVGTASDAAAVRKSNLTLGGPNQKAGVALVDGNIDAPGVRELVDEYGANFGCHTCPAMTPGTPSGRWIPDHQPPTALVSPGTPQTAFPHCRECALSQGGVVSQINQNAARGRDKPF